MNRGSAILRGYLGEHATLRMSASAIVNTMTFLVHQYDSPVWDASKSDMNMTKYMYMHRGWSLSASLFAAPAYSFFKTRAFTLTAREVSIPRWPCIRRII
jgi:hypothetical protein